MNLGKVLLKQLMEAGRELQDSRIVFSDVLSLVDLLFLENIQTLQILQGFSLFLNGGKNHAARCGGTCLPSSPWDPKFKARQGSKVRASLRDCI